MVKRVLKRCFVPAYGKESFIVWCNTWIACPIFVMWGLTIPTRHDYSMIPLTLTIGTLLHYFMRWGEEY